MARPDPVELREGSRPVAAPLRNPRQAEPRVGIIGREVQRSAERGFGFVEAAHRQLREADLQMDVGILRLRFGRAAEMLQGLFRISRLPRGDARLIILLRRLRGCRDGERHRSQRKRRAKLHPVRLIRRANRATSSSRMNGLVT